MMAGIQKWSTKNVDYIHYWCYDVEEQLNNNSQQMPLSQQGRTILRNSCYVLHYPFTSKTFPRKHMPGREPHCLCLQSNPWYTESKLFFNLCLLCIIQGPAWRIGKALVSASQSCVESQGESLKGVGVREASF